MYNNGKFRELNRAESHSSKIVLLNQNIPLLVAVAYPEYSTTECEFEFVRFRTENSFENTYLWSRSSGDRHSPRINAGGRSRLLVRTGNTGGSERNVQQIHQSGTFGFIVSSGKKTQS